MFSHLNNLNYLDLRGNACIDRRFTPVTSLAIVEQELKACGVNYPVSLTDLLYVQSQHESKLESIENQLKTINEKSEERENKFDRELEQVSELFAYVYQGNKQNAAEIKEIKKTVDKILEILTTK